MKNSLSTNIFFLSLTSTGYPFRSKEKNNLNYVIGFDEKQNNGKTSFSGVSGNRKRTVSFLGLKGENPGEWSVTEKN